MANEKKNLPTLAELHHDVAEAFKNDQLNLLLNQPPHEKWLKNHPLYKTKNATGQVTPWQFMPVDKVEYLILRIFGKWKREILSVGVMFQSVYAVVRLWVLDPVTGEWTFHDGAGAAPVQTDAGFSAADLSHIKSGAIQMALPAAVSYALKDAAECLGKLFGRDLNKNNTMMYSGFWEAPPETSASAEKPTPTPPPGPTPAPASTPGQDNEGESAEFAF